MAVGKDLNQRANLPTVPGLLAMKRMNRTRFPLLCAGLVALLPGLFLVSCASRTARDPLPLKVMTYNIRIGIAPIYTTFVDIHTAVMRMKQVMEEKIYEKYPKEAPKVT